MELYAFISYGHFILNATYSRFHISIQKIRFRKISSDLRIDFQVKQYNWVEGLLFFVESLIISRFQCFLDGGDCSNEILFVLVHNHLTLDGHEELWLVFCEC